MRLSSGPAPTVEDMARWQWRGVGMGSTGPTRPRLVLAEDNADVARALLRWLEIDFDILTVVTSSKA